MVLLFPPAAKWMPLGLFWATMQLTSVIPPELSIPADPTTAPVTVFWRKTQFLHTTLEPPPDFRPPPVPGLLTELERNEQPVRTGAPLVTRRPPPSSAKFEWNLRWLRVGEPPLSHMPPPRSWFAPPPLACPPVIVKPSRTPESVTVPSASTTW